MKMIIRILSFVIVAYCLVTSCSKDPAPESPGNGIYTIKKIVYKGKTVDQFLYSKSGKIAECQSYYFCDKYTYDDNDRLVKAESASSTGTMNSENFMTSQNSTFALYSSYEYNQDGILTCRKNYKKDDNDFEFVSKNIYEYQNGNIVKMNTLYDSDTIIAFDTYTYDNNGNVINEKHYSNIFKEGQGPVLQYEFSYKFDNKVNPFGYFKETARPGLYTNANNMIERNSTFYNVSQGTNNYSTSKMSYEYNSKGYPVKTIEGTTVYEYVYD